MIKIKIFFLYGIRLHERENYSIPELVFRKTQNKIAGIYFKVSNYGFEPEIKLKAACVFNLKSVKLNFDTQKRGLR